MPTISSRLIEGEDHLGAVRIEQTLDGLAQSRRVAPVPSESRKMG